MGAPVIRFDIGCRDKAASVAFYETVFGWTARDARFNTEIDTGAGAGINGAVTALGHEPHNYVMIYMGVDDADAACDAIRAAGGTVTIGPIDIPDDGGRFAWFRDPEGNLLGIFEAPAGAKGA